MTHIHALLTRVPFLAPLALLGAAFAVLVPAGLATPSLSAVVCAAAAGLGLQLHHGARLRRDRRPARVRR